MCTEKNISIVDHVESFLMFSYLRTAINIKKIQLTLLGPLGSLSVFGLIAGCCEEHPIQS